MTAIQIACCGAVAAGAASNAAAAARIAASKSNVEIGIMEPSQRKTLFIVALLLGFAFWPKIQPVVQPYIDKVVITNSNPFEDSKLRVLVVHDAENPNVGDLSDIVASVPFRELIEAAGGEFRAFDNQAEYFGANELEYKKIIEANKDRPRPFIVIGNGSKGTIEALPSYEDTEALIRKYL